MTIALMTPDAVITLTPLSGESALVGVTAAARYKHHEGHRHLPGRGCPGRHYGRYRYGTKLRKDWRMAQTGRSGTVREVERKYESPAGRRLPQLTELPGISRVDGPDVLRLRATYFDTADLRLARRGITLRRRTGGDDPGWHLKLPVSADTRVEVHEPLGRPAAAAPDRLVDLVLAYTRDAPLSPVAQISTTRRRHRLLDAHGQGQAEVAMDAVTARTLEALGEPMSAESWREVEVELAAGDLGLLNAADELLTAAGFVRATTASKLANLLDTRLGHHILSRAPGFSRPDAVGTGAGDSNGTRRAGAGRTAASVLLSYLVAQVDRLLSYDAKARADEPDAVHQMRVATRRLRSALREFGGLIDPNANDDLDGELRWLAGELGEVRDIEVLRARLQSLLAALPTDLVVGPVGERIGGRLGMEYDAARARLLDAMVSARYFALLDRLDRLVSRARGPLTGTRPMQGDFGPATLVAEPPFTEPAGGRAADVLAPLVRRSWRRFARRAARILDHVSTLGGTGSTESMAADIQHGGSEEIHAARKSAKRVRYVLEAVRPAVGRDAQRASKQLARIQEVLGAHQDTVVARDVIQRLCSEARTAGEDTFTYGVLYQAEASRGQRALADFAPVWQRASAKISRLLR
jgi:CHAD domain-containing protein